MAIFVVRIPGVYKDDLYAKHVKREIAQVFGNSYLVGEQIAKEAGKLSVSELCSVRLENSHVHRHITVAQKEELAGEVVLVNHARASKICAEIRMAFVRAQKGNRKLTSGNFRFSDLVPGDRKRDQNPRCLRRAPVGVRKC